MKGWPTKPLRALGQLDRGRSRHRPRGEPSLYGGPYPFVQTGDIANANGRISTHTQTYSELGLSQSRMWPTGTLCITIAANIAKTAILTFAACFPDSVVGFIPGDLVRTDFVRYWFLTIQSRLEEEAPQAAQKNINLRILGDLSVPVPPPAEQERIVKLLDEADKLRKLRAQADRRTAALIPALFDEMFGDPELNSRGWETHLLEEVIENTKLGLVRGAKEMGDSLAFPYLRMDGIQAGGRLSLEPVKRVNASAAEVAEFSLKDGDFLFNTRNSRELVGKTALYEGGETFLFNNNIMRIRFKNFIEPHYMLALFQTDSIGRQLEMRKSGTTSVVAIYYKNLRTLRVLTPPIKQQTEFAELVAEIRAMEAEQAASHRRLEDLFQSLLHRAFNGEL